MMFIHPQPAMPDRPAFVEVQAVAPNAGAAGTSPAAASAAPPSTRRAQQSDSRGQLATRAVPGGVNKAPNQGPKSGSFSGPISK